jgi:GNAT superfamily N-acetyltransferase
MKDGVPAMNAVRIRTATPDDLETLLRFQAGVVTAERAFDPTLKQDAVQYYDLEHMISAENVRFLVAEMGAKAVGCGFARIEAAKHYLQHRTHGYLGLMYVHPDYRGQSINGKIVSALKEWCRFMGVTELRLEAYSANEPAVRAYEKAGFSKHVVEMRMGLGRNEVSTPTR